MRALRLVLLSAVVFAGLGGARSAAGQTGKLTGQVTDASTGKPIEGVTVLVQGINRGAITGSNGRYFLLSVPPGTYVVVARRIGFQTQERRNVQVLIDVTREVDFSLASSAGQLSAMRIEAQAEPLVQPGTTGSVTSISVSELDALPVASIQNALALQLGFLNVPIENTDVTSFADERRGVTSVRIRGGRAGETQTMVDGIPINNFVLGGPSFDLVTDAVEALNYERGGFEAQYGNAMSGIINIATREGTSDLRGAISVQSSRVAGHFGSLRDSLLGRDILQGRVQGPVPLTGERVRWIVAGRQSTGAQRALQFDNQIFSPYVNPADPRGNTAQAFDLFPGWRSVGFNDQRDVFGKITALLGTTTKLSVGGIDYRRQYQDFNPAWVLTGYDMVSACKDAYPGYDTWCDRIYGIGNPKRWEDIISAGSTAFQTNKYSIQGSTGLRRTLYWTNLNRASGRTSVKVAAGRLYAARNACDWLTGICLGDKIRNYTTAQSFVRGRFVTASTVNAPYVNPGAGSENFAGGDTNTTVTFRGDVESQITDHHNLKLGGFIDRHDIHFYEAKNLSRPFDASVIGNYTYGGRPWDAAIYAQDRIEYDFLTVKFGLRFDYTRADGSFFANPLDPTNGTTAFEVCNGEAARVGATTPFAYTDPTSGKSFSGFAACNIATDASGKFFLLDSARRVAFQDDFVRAPIRKQFSPRIGVSFPVSEHSSFFMNWGIYSQIPLFNNMYQGTGIGRRSDSLAFNTLFPGDSAKAFRKGQSLEGTPLGPNFRQDFGNIPIIGNPRLAIEKTSSYEIGYLTQLGQTYALRVTGYAKDQSGLTGFRTGGVREDGTSVLDPASTYGSTTLNYRVLVNTDFQTVRGVELIFSRRLERYWAFDLKYGYQQVTTNAAPPELELQKIIERDVQVSREVRSETDQPHLFTGILRFETGDRPPEAKLVGVRLAPVIRNAKLTFTTRAASGLPYTPQTTFTGLAQDRLERNSGTAPPTWTVDMLVEKKWRSGNLLYGAFVSVTNLFDRRNCVQVYPTTGQCDAGALTQLRGLTGPFQNGGGVDPNAVGATGVTTTQFDLPNLYADRRFVMTGLRVSF